MEDMQIIDWLKVNFGYTEEDAELVVEKLQYGTYEVKNAFKKLWDGLGLNPNLEVQGYTLKNLVDDYDMTPIAALLTMDWLIREPKEAIQALAEGYDSVYTPETEEASQHTDKISSNMVSLRRYALIVGINEEASTNIPSLQHAETDALALANILQQHGNFEMIVPPIIGQAATTATISNALLKLTENRNENDTILFYFAGHGIETASATINLLPYDFGEQYSAISVEALRQGFYETTHAGQSILILDCCYVGALEGFDKPRKTLPVNSIAFQQKLAEYFETPKREENVFSHRLRAALISATIQRTGERNSESMSTLLLRALQNQTDTPMDERAPAKPLSLQEVYNYVASKMPDDMKPELEGNVEEQSFILATAL